ncbi:hypothetical protein [Terrabacter sp. NPDC000476]|uniref:hypothetical protein n=1 Tax=Terrabacter sp. NPDC000476 TaxID=3154258 RepID=UPI00332742D5
MTLTANEIPFIVERGELPARKKRLGLFPKPIEGLPTPKPGQQVVLFSADGSTVRGDALTPGDRTWGDPRSFVVVDTSIHHVSLVLAEVFATNFGYFDASAKLTAQVTDAAQAASSGADGLRSLLQPRLRGLIRATLAQLDGVNSKSPSKAEVLTMQRHAERRLATEILGQTQGLSFSWLTAHIESVEVMPSAATKEHLIRIQTAMQDGKVGRLTGDMANLANAKRMRFWQREFKRYLPGKMARVLAVAMMNPSREHVDDVLGRLREAEQEERRAVLQVFETMVREDMIEDSNPAVQALMNRVKREIGGSKDTAVASGFRDHETLPAADDADLAELDADEIEDAEPSRTEP